MTVIVTKDAINLREKLSELDKETGIKGEEIMRADTSAEAREALQLDQQLFTDFESTGIDDNATSTAITIDSSNNLLVGKTATGLDVEGIQIVSGGLSGFTRDAGVALVLNRETDDGNVMQFRKDNLLVGSIGTASGDLHIDGAASHSGIRFQASSLLPRLNGADTDATIDLGYDDGTSIHRFRDLYLSGGVYLGGSVAANLLDDYEEGLWTPLLVPQTGAFTSQTIINYLTDKPRYTKIGNLVMVSVLFTTYELTKGTGSGNVYLGGLPFEVYTSSVATISDASTFLGDYPSSGGVGYQADKIALQYRTSPNGNDLNLQVSDLGTADGSNTFRLTLVYRTNE